MAVTIRERKDERDQLRSVEIHGSTKQEQAKKKKKSKSKRLYDVYFSKLQNQTIRYEIVVPERSKKGNTSTSIITIYEPSRTI